MSLLWITLHFTVQIQCVSSSSSFGIHSHTNINGMSIAVNSGTIGVTFM